MSLTKELDMAAERFKTHKVSVPEARDHLDSLLHEVSRNESRVIVEDAGIPVAALVSVEDLQRWTQSDKEREARFAVIDRMRAAFADASTEEIEREIAKAVAEVRNEMAAERQKHRLAS